MQSSDEEQKIIKICALMIASTLGAWVFIIVAMSGQFFLTSTHDSENIEKWATVGCIVFVILFAAFSWNYSGLSKRGNFILFVVSYAIFAAIDFYLIPSR